MYRCGMNEISTIIFKERYALHESETFEEACHRVAAAAASVESPAKIKEWTDKFYEELVNCRFVPGGRIWYGAGRPKATMLNCFALDTVARDSREGWGDLVTHAICIGGASGGLGISYSGIRPRGAVIRGTGGRSTGSVSLMHIVNAAATVIEGGGGRRGAHIAVLSIQHPDLEEFVAAKLDHNALNMMNISVAFDTISPEVFLRLVEEDAEMELVWKNEIIKKIKARVIWDKILDGFLKNGEPGIINLHYANSMNNIAYHTSLASPNPCVAGDTLVAVADGRCAVSIKQLAEEGKDVPVYCCSPSGKTAIRYGRAPRKTGEQLRVLKVTLDDGSNIRVTANHKFVLRDGFTKCEAQNLQPGMSLFPYKSWQSYGREKHSNVYHHVYRYGYEKAKRIRAEHNFLFDELSEGVPSGSVVHHKDYNGTNNNLDNLQIMSAVEHRQTHLLDYNSNPMQGGWWDKITERERDQYRQKMSEKFMGKGNPRYGQHCTAETKLRISLANTKPNLPSYKIKMAYIMRDDLRDDINESGFYLGHKNCFVEHGVIYKEARCHNCLKPYVVRFERRNEALFCPVCLLQMGAIHKTQDKNIRPQALGEAVIEKFIEYVCEHQEIPELDVFNVVCGFNYCNGASLLRATTYKNYQQLCDAVCQRLGISFFNIRSLCNWSRYGRLEEAKKVVQEIVRSADDLMSAYNHKVVSVVEDGYEDVYNITVDEFHTVSYVTRIGSTFDGLKSYQGVVTANCGEIMLPDNGVCDLGHLVLPNFFKRKELDLSMLDKSIRRAVRFLDNILDVTQYPTAAIAEEAKGTRRIGLGFTGLHDLILLYGLRYGSEGSLDLTDKLCKFIKNKSYETSTYIAAEKGSFPKFDADKFLAGNFTKTIKKSLRDKIKEHGIRNCALNTVAPTGTVSLLVGGCSNGCEPVFGPAYKTKRWRKTSEFATEHEVVEETVFHPLFNKAMLEQQTVDYFESVVNIPVEAHFKVQHTIQQHIDQSISKTILLPALTDDVKDTFQQCFKKYFPELKGITVYVQGSRPNEPVVPLGLEEAKELWRNTEQVVVEDRSVDSCKDGKCDL